MDSDSWKRFGSFRILIDNTAKSTRNSPGAYVWQLPWRGGTCSVWVRCRWRSLSPDISGRRPRIGLPNWRDSAKQNNAKLWSSFCLQLENEWISSIFPIHKILVFGSLPWTTICQTAHNYSIFFKVKRTYTEIEKVIFKYIDPQPCHGSQRKKCVSW